MHSMHTDIAEEISTKRAALATSCWFGCWCHPFRLIRPPLGMVVMLLLSVIYCLCVCSSSKVWVTGFDETFTHALNRRQEPIQSRSVSTGKHGIHNDLRTLRWFFLCADFINRHTSICSRSSCALTVSPVAAHTRLYDVVSVVLFLRPCPWRRGGVMFGRNNARIWRTLACVVHASFVSCGHRHGCEVRVCVSCGYLVHMRS